MTPARRTRRASERRRDERRAVWLGVALSVAVHGAVVLLPLRMSTPPAQGGAAASAPPPGTRLIDYREVAQPVGEAAPARRTPERRDEVPRTEPPSRTPAGATTEGQGSRGWSAWLRQTIRPGADPRLAAEPDSIGRAARTLALPERAARPAPGRAWDGGPWGPGSVPIEPSNPGGPFPSAAFGAAPSVSIPIGPDRRMPPPLPVPPPPPGWRPPTLAADSARADGRRAVVHADSVAGRRPVPDSAAPPDTAAAATRG